MDRRKNSMFAWPKSSESGTGSQRTVPGSTRHASASSPSRGYKLLDRSDAGQREPLGVRRLGMTAKGKFEVDNVDLPTNLGPHELGSPLSPAGSGSPWSPQGASHARSRRPSLKHFIQRSSRELSKGFQIVKMNDEERRKYYSAKKRAIERDMEATRPLLATSPTAATTPAASASASSSRGPLAADDAYSFDAVEKQVRADQEVVQAKLRARSATIVQKKVGGDDGGRCRRPSSGALRMGQGEKAANAVSRAFDVLKKQHRDDSDNSSMDFADDAPVEKMWPCVRCLKPTSKFLKGGRCQECVVNRG